MDTEMRETEQNITFVNTPESARDLVTQAGNRTLDALKGSLSPEKRNYYEGLLENLNGARALFSKNGLRMTSSLVLAVSFLTSCAPAVVGPVIPDEGAGPGVTETSPTTIPSESTIREKAAGVSYTHEEVLVATADNPFPYAAIEQSQHFHPDAVFAGESLEYDGVAKYSIDKIKNDFGIDVVSPRTWDGEANRPWSNIAISILYKTIKNLPTDYLNNTRTPKQILLFSLPSKDKQLEGGLTAGYGNRQITINMPGDFNPLSPSIGTYQEHFGSQEFLLEGFIKHEFTHAYTEAHPEILEEWIAEMGWHWDGKNWTNDNPASLIQESGADLRPVEDIAVSASLLSNPVFLSRDRLNFLQSHSDFQGLER